jgi:hypothetical protein
VDAVTTEPCLDSDKTEEDPPAVDAVITDPDLAFKPNLWRRCRQETASSQLIVSQLFGDVRELPQPLVQQLQDELVTFVENVKSRLWACMSDPTSMPPRMHSVVTQTVHLVTVNVNNFRGLIGSTRSQAESILGAVEGRAPLTLSALTEVSHKVWQISTRFLEEALRQWTAQAVHILNYTLLCIRKEHPRLYAVEEQIDIMFEELSRIASTLGNASMCVAASVANQVMANILIKAEDAASKVQLHQHVNPPDVEAEDECGFCEPPETAPNCGSVGHPHLCNRPCRYAAEGGCENGTQCGYCHMPHSRRSVHQDKKTRDLLRRMPPPSRSAVILDAIHEKLKDIGLSQTAKQELSSWALQLGIALSMDGGAAQLDSYKQADLRRLRTCLRSSTFQVLCSRRHDIAENQDAASLQATQTFLRSLRILKWTQDLGEASSQTPLLHVQ